MDFFEILNNIVYELPKIAIKNILNLDLEYMNMKKE